MKANELRISSIFRWKSTGKVDNVKSIVTVGSKTYINDVCISDCEPVKLDEDWFREFGFNQVNTSWYKDENFAIYEIITLSYKKAYCFVSDDMFIKDFEIKHVHQLQNLYFALTGSELTTNPE